MDARREFLELILGTAGVTALEPLTKASPEVESYLLPRATAAWLESIDIGDIVERYTDEFKFAISKSLNGYSGAVQDGSENSIGYVFQDASIPHVAASIAYFLGAAPGTPDLRDIDLARLGRTVDLLVKAQIRGAIRGAPETGTTAGSIEPNEPEPPIPTAPKADKTKGTYKPKLPKLPKLPTGNKPIAPSANKQLKLSEAEARITCSVCAQAQFSGEVFTGCFCLRDLRKTVRTEPLSGGYKLIFGLDWDDDALLTLMEAIGR